MNNTSIEQNKAKWAVYLIIRGLVVAALIAQAFNHNWHNVMTCVLTLILLMLPQILSRRLSVAIHPEGLNVPVPVEVEQVTVNGMTWDEYLDVGLYDTMHDLWINFLGAVTFSILGWIYIKNRGKGFAAKFMPTLKGQK